METADVVVIGGGVVGLSVAYHLAERGLRDVLVLERGRCGGGATLKATGGVRLQFGTAVNVRLSLLALPFWQSFDERFGTRADFAQQGYLFLATTPAQLAQLERNTALQRSLGVPTRLVTPAEAAALTPGLNADGLLGGAFCPWDGWLAVEEVVTGLLAGCRRAGVTVREGVAVTGVALAGERVAGVATAAGPVAAPVVVNAAGPWAAAAGALAGLTVPVRPARRQAALTEPAAGLAPSAPLTIDLGRGVYVRPAPGGGGVIGGGDRELTADLPADVVDWPGLERTRALVGERFPGLAGVALARAWVGLREMSPDDHAILGSTPVAGFLCAAGFSGHGLMHAPAAGKLIAELVVDGAARSLDMTPLRLARFAEGDLVHETAVF